MLGMMTTKEDEMNINERRDERDRNSKAMTCVREISLQCWSCLTLSISIVSVDGTK